MSGARNSSNADRYLAYLATNDTQDIYARHGFLKASAAEVKLKSLEPLPAKK